MVRALAISRLDYGNALYVGIQSRLLMKLQRMQNAAARLILDIPKYDPISHHLRDLHGLSVKKRIQFKSQCIAYKAIQGKGPQYLRTHLRKYIPTRNLRSCQANLLTIPRYRQVRWGGRSFMLGTARTWNSLPTVIKNSSSLSSFRKLLKTWLFNNWKVDYALVETAFTSPSAKMPLGISALYKSNNQSINLYRSTPTKDGTAIQDYLEGL